MWEKEPEATQLMKVVAILQADFLNMTLANKSTCQMVVMIPKGGGGYFWGIGLVDVLWKTVTGLLNCLFTLAIQFHDVIHVFKAGHRMGTSSLKAKMLQQFTATREAVLYEISLDLQKT